MRKPSRATDDGVDMRMVRSLARRRSFRSVFLLSALDSPSGPDRATRWATALRLCKDMEGNGERPYWKNERISVAESRLAMLSSNWLLPCCRAGTIAGPPPLGALVAVIRDGQEDSIDALLAEVERCRDDGHVTRLRFLLRLLKRYARTPGMVSMREVAASMLHRDPVGRFAATIGLLSSALECSFMLSGSGRRRPLLTVVISDESNALSCHSGLGSVVVSRTSEVRKIQNVPAWISRLEATLRTRWDWSATRVKSNLRGRERAALLEWLKTGRLARLTPADASPRKVFEPTRPN